MRVRRRPWMVVLLVVGLTIAACTDDAAPQAASSTTTTTTTPTSHPTTTAEPGSTTTFPGTRPSWLGRRVLPRRPDRFGEVRPTPPELRDRRFATIDLRPPPPDTAFHSTVALVPDDGLARSTWKAACPVGVDDLRYLTMSFWGFDGRPHTGEMIVNRSVADDVVAVFARLQAARFPIEEMRVVGTSELDAEPTGDGNNTSAFECRPTVGSSHWSEHASGLAVDVNPFQNPYVKGDLVLPELASAYLDRRWQRPGMIGPDAEAAFASAGWKWGGRWRSLKDFMHFSPSGR